MSKSDGNTSVSILVNNKRMGAQYKISRFTEYRVDMDLETDTDGFDFVFSNPGGVYTGIANKFDEVDIKINNRVAIKGDIDRVQNVSDNSGSKIHVTGRDKAHILVDNDAIPGTKQNVDPVAYARSVCGTYGVKFYSSFGSLSVANKLIIGCGESEISIINNLILNERKKLWYVYDTLYLGDWATGSAPVYYFTRGVPSSIQGIPIESLSLDDNGTDTKSEVRIYGSMNDGSDKVLGTAKNDVMISRGIIRRKVKWSSNNDTTAKYSSSALRDVRDSFKDNIVLEIKVKTHPDILVYPNATAHVIDVDNKINSIFFIKSVTYEKSTSGSFTTVRMIPGDTTFNILWSGQASKENGGITGTPSTTASQVISNRK